MQRVQEPKTKGLHMTTEEKKVSILEDALKDDDLQDEVIQTLEEKVVGRGVANALAIFRERGMLGKTLAFGRNKDKTLDQQLSSFGISKNQEDDRVKLEYVDKRGRKLTLKEAFRQLCWRFHGKMPSHRKQEKRRLKEEIEEKKNFTGMNLPQVAGNAFGSL